MPIFLNLKLWEIEEIPRDKSISYEFCDSELRPNSKHGMTQNSNETAHSSVNLWTMQIGSQKLNNRIMPWHLELSVFITSQDAFIT